MVLCECTIKRIYFMYWPLSEGGWPVPDGTPYPLGGKSRLMWLFCLIKTFPNLTPWLFWRRGWLPRCLCRPELLCPRSPAYSGLCSWPYNLYTSRVIMWWLKWLDFDKSTIGKNSLSFISVFQTSTNFQLTDKRQFCLAVKPLISRFTRASGSRIP